MTISRRLIVVAAGASGVMTLAAPFAAQAQSAADRLAECARIEDPSARLACYDSQLRTQGADTVADPAPAIPSTAPALPPQVQAPAQVPAQSPATVQAAGVSATAPASDFGLPAPRERVSQEITATIAEIRARQPGIYLVTLDDGAQWLFTEGVRRTYRVPRKGDSITIESASMGSFLMRFDRQAAVRVVRLR